MIRRALLAALLAWGAAARAQSPRIVLGDAGPGDGGAPLRTALAGPYRVAPPDTAPYVVARGTTVRGPFIVLGRDAIVDGTVDGDLLVVDGDLYTHPGARVSGDAVTFGGGIYESALATIAGRPAAFRDFTYDISPIPGGYALSYRSLVVRPRSILEWAGPLGFVVPGYDRTDGVTLPVAASVAGPHSPVDVEAALSYRSQLGAFDPSVDASAELNRRTTVRLSAGRTTLTNDDWIRPDLSNSAATLLLGDDMRNYYRATRVEGTLGRRWEGPARTVQPYLGARWERASSTRPDSGAGSAPWSLTGRHDIEDMLRPNPRIDDGDLASAIGGATLAWSSGGVSTESRLDLELGHGTRMRGAPEGATFGQATLDARFTLEAFRGQRLRVLAHAVLTTPGATPRQRWAYLGGPGSLATLEPLALGGDELLYFDGDYDIPLDRVTLPFVGSPVLTLRDAIGSAGVRSLPGLDQAIGARVSASFLYFELLVDPANRHVSTGIGFGTSR